MCEKRVVFDFDLCFSNGGGLQGQDFRLDISGDSISDEALALYIIQDLRLLMVKEVHILKKKIIDEEHKRTEGRSSEPEIGTLHTTTEGIPMNNVVRRELLQTTSVMGTQDWEQRLFLITYPPGADGSNHSHPVVGVGFVLEGTMVSAFDDDAEAIFKAGQSFMDRASFHRVSRNGSVKDPLKFVIAYAVRKGQPNTVWPAPD